MSTIPYAIEQRTVQAFLDSGVFERIIKKEWKLAEKYVKRIKEEDKKSS